MTPQANFGELPPEPAGPDGCPWHYREPTDVIELYDDGGRYRGPATAEVLCGGWHTHAVIRRQLAAALGEPGVTK